MSSAIRLDCSGGSTAIDDHGYENDHVDKGDHDESLIIMIFWKKIKRGAGGRGLVISDPNKSFAIFLYFYWTSPAFGFL